MSTRSRAPTQRAFSRHPRPRGRGRGAGEARCLARQGRPRHPALHARVPRCKFCLSRKTNLCQAIRATAGAGPDARRHLALSLGEPLFHYMGTSTFRQPHRGARHRAGQDPARRALRQGLLHRLRRHHRHRAVLFTAKVEAGANVVVFGLGGIGLNVIQGAKMVGPTRSSAWTSTRARGHGAALWHDGLHQPPKDVGNVVDHIVQMTDGGADYSFECVGNVQLMRQALGARTRAGAAASSSACRRAGAEISTAPSSSSPAASGKGAPSAAQRGRTDVPKIVDWYMDGKIQIDGSSPQAAARTHQRRFLS